MTTPSFNYLESEQRQIQLDEKLTTSAAFKSKRMYFIALQVSKHF
jgi:hypothetical protein